MTLINVNISIIFRKVVIAFAFMVPDVKYNEAYISFIFTHPEWRGAGIAKFMLYHLIQVNVFYYELLLTIRMYINNVE